VVRNEPECVKLLDREGRLLDMNPAGLSMLQARLDQVEGQRASGLVAEEDRASFDEMVVGVFRGESRHLVFDMIGLEGRRLTLETTSVPLWDSPERNRVTTLLGVTRDITARKRAEEALKRAADDWLTTFDALEAGVLLLDAEDRVERLNGAAAALAGEERSGLLGRRVADLGQGEPWDAVRQVVAAVRARGAAELRQVRGERGRAWDVDATLTPGREGPARLVVSVRDVTRLVDLQESVKRSERMAAMGSLVAGVAHEVRNPLFAILANVDALGAVLEQQADVADLLEAMRKEVDRLRRLMEELLEYGKPSRPQEVQEGLQPCLDLALHECRGPALAAGVEVRCATTPDGVPLRLDRSRLAQVFENVVMNAIQHSPAGGQVALGFEGFLEDGRKWVRCLVEDQGPGFGAEDLPRLFDPFFTRRRGGTGLGLAIAQRIAEEHGGRIQVRNRESGGGCVVIELPGAASAQPVLAAEP
jgi:PAS domain S-box-containing protein